MNLNFISKPIDCILRHTLGLGIKRFRQWKTVMVDEQRAKNPLATTRSAAFAALQLVFQGTATRRRWKARLKRGCGRCPVYNPVTKACRDTAGMQLGCGCYMPFKAFMPKKACWIRQQDPASPHGFD